MMSQPDSVSFAKGKWFVNRKDLVSDMIFSNNGVRLLLEENSTESFFYLIMGNAVVNQKNTDGLFPLNRGYYAIYVEVSLSEGIEAQIFVQQYDENHKIASQAYSIRNGSNTIQFSTEENVKYLKCLIRIQYMEKGDVSFSNLLIETADHRNERRKEESIQLSSRPLSTFLRKSDILNEPFVYDTYVQYSLVLDELQTDILTHFKKSDKLVVFYNGAVDIQKTPPPVFQRWSWFKDMPYSCMSIMDPTIYELAKKNNDQTFIGWYRGNREVWILEKLVALVQEVAEKLNIDRENILFYGSSAGGFASLISGAMIKGSRICVVNPQIDVMAYHQKNVEILIKHLNGGSVADHRLDAIACFQHLGYFPSVYYKQNKQDVLHYEKHFKYFENAYRQKQLDKKLTSVLIDDRRGHSAIPVFSEALEDIKKVFAM